MAYDEIVESSTPDLTPSSSSVSIVADIVTWPWPRIISTNYHIFGFFKQSNASLYLVEMSMDNYAHWEGYVVGTLGAASNVQEISVADFGPFYIISVLGADLIPRCYVRDTTLINGVSDRDVTGISFISSFTLPAFGTCCNFNSQLIAGNIYSTSSSSSNIWADFTSNYFIWSGIGSFELNPTVDITAGYRQLLGIVSSGSFLPTIYKLLPLQEGVVLYSDIGNFLLKNELVGSSFTYSLTSLKGLGIISGNHVAGDIYIHGFVDTNRDFWLLEERGKLTKRGYRDYISPLFDAASPIIVSYISRNNTFYISNGLKSVVINSFGAYTTHQAVSGIVQAFDNKLYGTYYSSSDTVGRIVLDSEDFGQRGIKSLESLLVGLSHSSGTKVTYGTDYRNSKSASFHRSLLKRGNPSGEARIGVSASEFRPVITFTTYEGSEISTLIANVKFPDNRYRRAAIPTASGVNS